MAKEFQCPNCFAVWSYEEIDWDHCDACGYPNHDEQDDEEEFDPDQLEDDGDDDDERYSPIDSRNL